MTFHCMDGIQREKEKNNGSRLHASIMLVFLYKEMCICDFSLFLRVTFLSKWMLTIFSFSLPCANHSWVYLIKNPCSGVADSIVKLANNVCVLGWCENESQELLCWWKVMRESARTWHWTSCWGKGMTSQVFGDGELEGKRSDKQLRPSGERTEVFKGVFKGSCTGCVMSMFFPLPPKKAAIFLHVLAVFSSIAQKYNIL